MRTHFIENDDLLILVVPLRLKILTRRICYMKLFTVFLLFYFFLVLLKIEPVAVIDPTARACCSWRHSMPIVGVRLLLLFR